MQSKPDMRRQHPRQIESFLSNSMYSAFLSCSERYALAGTFQALGCQCPIGALRLAAPGTGEAANALPHAVHIRIKTAIDAIAAITLIHRA